MTEMLREQYPGTDNRGGLNIQQKEGSEINAVLVPMTGEETNFYEDMVLGYHLENMDADKIDASVNLPVIAAVSHNTMMLILSMAMLKIVLGSWNDWGVHKERFLRSIHVDGETFMSRLRNVK